MKEGEVGGLLPQLFFDPGVELRVLRLKSFIQ